MFLAAGFGKEAEQRSTHRLPKSLVPVGDRPAIQHALDSIRASLGHIPLVVNAHYKAKMVAEHFDRPSRDVKVVAQNEILGIVGRVPGRPAVFPVRAYCCCQRLMTGISLDDLDSFKRQPTSPAAFG